MKCTGIVPARYDSSRFPGKPLVELAGLPMIIHVIRNASEAESLDEVIVATDDQRIVEAVEEHGYRAVLTSKDHESGSDRIWEVAKDLDSDIILNIQGDEPAISGEVIESCLEPFRDNDDIDVVTLCRPIRKVESENPNLVKVVFAESGRALYFSRAPIPYHRFEKGSSEHFSPQWYGHIGIYAYRKTALKTFTSLPSSPLEKVEKLEQLRGLEAGMNYKVIKTEYRSIDVNVPEDVVRAEAALRQR